MEAVFSFIPNFFRKGKKSFRTQGKSAGKDRSRDHLKFAGIPGIIVTEKEKVAPEAIDSSSRNNIMLRIPCPKCGTYVFISDAGSFIPCPQCGAVFSGKHGPDKRKEPRVWEKINFPLSLEGRTYKASVSSLSAGGVGIKVFGRPPLAQGTLLTLPIGRPFIQARVMWVKQLSDQSLAGLQKV